MSAYALLLFVALSRVAELFHARRNERNLRARGAVEWGRAHYPLFILLHGGWLMAMLVLMPHPPALNIVFVLLYFCFFALRIWVIATLGPYWTTRIITLDAPLVAKGPYRFMRHPNYVAVMGEIASLPLAFGQWRIALVFSLLNAALLCWRIRIEDKALSPRRV
jgi:methyltransferase